MPQYIKSVGSIHAVHGGGNKSKHSGHVLEYDGCYRGTCRCGAHSRILDYPYLAREWLDWHFRKFYVYYAMDRERLTD